MKKLLTLICMLTISTQIYAHCGACAVPQKTKKAAHHSKSYKKMSAESLQKELNLSKEQTIKIKKILENRDAKIRTIQQSSKKEIVSILNKEQKMAFKNKKKDTACVMCED